MSTNIESASIWLLPYHSDPIEILCQQLVEQFSSQLPDLSGISILMPDTHAGSRLRKVLTQQANKSGFSALLGPNIQNLTQFIENTPVDHTLSVLPKATRELMLVEALRDYPDLYGKSSPWLLAEDLLQLFDDLSQQQSALPETLEEFTAQIEQAYAIPETESENIEQQLSHEAKLVHTLWQAWQQQLNDEQCIDQQQLTIEKLANYTQPDDVQHIFLVGFTRFSPAEQQWFNKLASKGSATLIVQGNHSVSDDYHPDLAIKNLLDNNNQNIFNLASDSSHYDETIDDIFTHNDINISQRAKSMQANHTSSPLESTLSILAANNAEQEALGIELQIRQWLHEGKKNIAVVTQDRRLARRLRALLERCQIPLRDYSGWALSTTSAAAALERWLECIEQDFNHLPLIDLLKSSFVFTSIEKEQLLYNVYRFEQDIVLHENIASSLYRYQRQIERRSRRIDERWTQNVADDLKDLLNNIAQAAEPLQRLQHGNHQPSEFIDALLASLESIEMITLLNSDAAGQRVIDEIHSMRHALSDREFSISWSEFRNWLGRTLERYNFVPDTKSTSVHLLDLNASLLNHYDAIIIAAADAEHLPGRPAVAAFFNDAVRYSLQLQTSEQYSVSMYYHFRCLLHAAPKVLVTYTANNDGNTNLASPWIECLQHYHSIAWGSSLEEQQIQQWLNHNYAGYSTPDKDSKTELVHQYPSINCEQDLLPLDISATAYQQLIDCPYQYFAARCLGLKATDEMRMVLEKSDYGSRVHKCLQAFHTDIDKLPGPFTSVITKDNRQQAIQCLNDISLQLFSHDLEDNFQHRGWLQAWQHIIPLYINWQMKHQASWQVNEAEKEITDKESGGFKLKGVLDRVDVSTDDAQMGIIDYKTGKPPRQADINNGEAVQLPFYALLLDADVNRVEYLELASKLKTSGSLEGDALQELTQAQSERLNSLFTQLQNGEPLPAWGDSKACRYCEMDGLCRRDAWQIEMKVAE